MSYVNAIVNHQGHYVVLLRRNPQLNILSHTSDIKRGKNSQPYLACEHIWHSGQDYQMRFLRTSEKKHTIYLVKDSVIVSLSLSSDTSVYVLELDMSEDTL